MLFDDQQMCIQATRRGHHQLLLLLLPGAVLAGAIDVAVVVYSNRSAGGIYDQSDAAYYMHARTKIIKSAVSRLHVRVNLRIIGCLQRR